MVQYHYTTWPDHGAPSHATALWRVHREVTSQADKDKPIVVHCRSVIASTSCEYHLQRYALQCWSRPYWNVHSHGPSAGGGQDKEGSGRLQLCGSSQAEQNEHGSDTGKLCLPLHTQPFYVLWLIIGPISVHPPSCSGSIHRWNDQCDRDGFHATLL